MRARGRKRVKWISASADPPPVGDNTLIYTLPTTGLSSFVPPTLYYIYIYILSRPSAHFIRTRSRLFCHRIICWLSCSRSIHNKRPRWYGDRFAHVQSQIENDKFRLMCTDILHKRGTFLWEIYVNCGIVVVLYYVITVIHISRSIMYFVCNLTTRHVDLL